MQGVEETQSSDFRAAGSELGEPVWSVISFEQVKARSLRYDEAVAMLSELAHRGVPGLCIVTNEAASRIKTQE